MARLHIYTCGTGHEYVCVFLVVAYYVSEKNFETVHLILHNQLLPEIDLSTSTLRISTVLGCLSDYEFGVQLNCR